MKATQYSVPVLLVAACLVFLGVAAWAASQPPAEPEDAAATAPPPKHPVHIRTPAGPPVVQTGELDLHGNAVATNCTTCHANRAPNRGTRSGEQIQEVHLGMSMNHGDLTCLSCHNDADYNTLKRADGSAIDYPNVMQLCAQCHGPQHRDYQHGSHGGMTGHWDLSRGPRERNNCIDCHNPHTPQVPQVRPVLPPKDRFLSQHDHEEATHE